MIRQPGFHDAVAIVMGGVNKKLKVRKFIDKTSTIIETTRWCSWNTDLAFTTLTIYSNRSHALFVQQHVKGTIIAQQ